MVPERLSDFSDERLDFHSRPIICQMPCEEHVQDTCRGYCFCTAVIRVVAIRCTLIETPTCTRLRESQAPGVPFGPRNTIQVSLLYDNNR